MKTIKVTGKTTGLRLLEEIINNNLSCGTMIRYKRNDVALMSNPPQPVYEYYKYTAGDKRFHRCDENGKLGAIGQQRFMNYATLKKEFEILEIEEEQDIEYQDIKELTDDDIYFYPECSDDSKENFKDKINELVRAVNELKKNER